MSDTSAFPFGSAAGPDEDAEGPDRRKLLLFVALGVIAVALVGYYIMAAIGGTDQRMVIPANLAAPLPGASPQPSPNASPAPTAAPAPQSFALAGHRNPFIPLVTAGGAGGGAGAGASAAPGAPGAPGGTPPGGMPSGSAAPTSTTFRLVSVSGVDATVTINEKSYTVKPGQTFATKYKLITISNGKCAEFTHSGNPLSLCEGQTVTF